MSSDRAVGVEKLDKIDGYYEIINFPVLVERNFSICYLGLNTIELV